MTYRIASDNQPNNPNPHAWDLGAETYETEQEAWDVIQEQEKAEEAEYGYIWGSMLVLHEPGTVVEEGS